MVCGDVLEECERGCLTCWISCRYLADFSAMLSLVLLFLPFKGAAKSVWTIEIARFPQARRWGDPGLPQTG